MTVYLQDGTPVQIDEQDAHILELPGWFAYRAPTSTTHYVRRRFNGKPAIQVLHRLIMGVCDPKVFIDHKDRDGLNNVRSNLRICTNQQNLRNQYRNPELKKSRFKGVYRERQLWRARMCVNGKRVSLGYFNDEMAAARAYNDAVSRNFGEFARLNEGV